MNIESQKPPLRTVLKNE